MAPAVPLARRISYVVPPPAQDSRIKLVLPALDAPRRGRTVPLILRDRNASQIPISHDGFYPTSLGENASSNRKKQNSGAGAVSGSYLQPQHRLGVSALAVDLSTRITGKESPEGILYSGGRDGLVMAWELGVPTKPRHRKSRDKGVPSSRRGNWKAMTGWDDEDDTSDEDSVDSNDSVFDLQDSVLDGMQEPLLGGNQPQRTVDSSVPYEQQWQVDPDRIDELQPHSSFRQGVQSHGDWVNDIALCNLNQSVISASNDGTVKMWSPHELSSSSTPILLGKHSDYVRCLAHSPKQPWIASGSFDRTIKLWDLSRPASTERTSPVTTLSLGEANVKASVYALAVNATGGLLASGSPERVVRLWDPRSGRRIGKLVGHTDNIRSILISDDGKYLMTGSSDATIKIWSISAQRCLHTFEHHSDSVWSLYSSHPSLSIFYSGDRSGLVCKVDMENCSDISEGECVVVCRDTSEDSGHSKGKEGINKLVALDDWGVWTATGSSDIKRWQDPGRRSVRMSTDPTSQWDHTSLSSTGDTFGFSPMNNVIASRSPTPVATSPRQDSRSFYRTESPINTAFTLRTESPLPSPSRQSESHHRSPSASQRNHALFSVQSGAGSVMFVEDHPVSEAQGSDLTLFHIPFDCLVKLAPSNQGYGYGSSLPVKHDPEVATLYSAASVLSSPYRNSQSPPDTYPNPSAYNSRIHSASGTSYRSTPSTHMQYTTDPHIDARSPQAAYESRELAIDAVPLRSSPDEVIKGANGLVRSVILNDRLHALTVDTAGEVAVWDLVRGVCRGYFSSNEIENASIAEGSRHSNDENTEWSPRESLETVRERIEGEAMIASWATVDTKMGSLTVHLSESTCFDAEVYADEAGYGSSDGFQEEHRLNIGKWVLFNLFAGFVRAEKRTVASSQEPGSQTSSGFSKGIHRSPAPAHISLDNLKTRRLRSNSELTVMSPRTPGPAVSIMTPSMTPAVLPDVTPTPRNGPQSLVHQRDTLATIPASPGPPGEPTPRPYRPPEHNNPPPPLNRGVSSSDYFSHPRTDDNEASGPDQTPGPGKPASSSGVPSTPFTPGGRIMGRLRNLGKTKRPQTAEGGVSSPMPIQEGQEAVEESASARATRLNLQVLNELLSQPLQTPTPLDAPPVNFPQDLAIMISEQMSGDSGWSTLYHGLASSVEDDVNIIEATAPLWLLEYLLANKVAQQTMAKVSFVVVPWEGNGGDPLPVLLNNQARLTASRVLRIRKVLIYVMEKLDTIEKNNQPSHQAQPGSPRESELPSRVLASSPTGKSRDDPRRAEDLFEVLCNDVVLPINMTLASVRHYVWRQGGELVLHYRKKIAPSQENT